MGLELYWLIHTDCLLPLTAPRECFICGCVAEIECPQCLPDCKLQPGRIKQYCSTCNTQVRGVVAYGFKCKITGISKDWYCFSTLEVRFFLYFLLPLKVHAHRLRQGHSPRALAVPPQMDTDNSVPRHMMQLFAVLCIKTSHYVSFVKYGPDTRSWLFFDSMADRCGETDLSLPYHYWDHQVL